MMRPIAVIGACVAMLFALTATSASAEAIAPELGRCVAQTGGAHSNSGCTTAAKKVGKFEWEPGADGGFTSAGGVALIETVNKGKLTCKAAAGSGIYLNRYEAETSFVLTKCESVSAKVGCSTVGAENGEFRSNLLISTLGSIKPKSVGVDLTGKEGPNVIEFECGGSGSGDGALVFVHGSVIAPVTPANKMSTTFAQKFKAAKGLQKPTSFEGQPEDTLTMTTVLSKTEKTEEKAGLTLTLTITNQEPLEIRDSD
jgi:hypothetical protein